MGGGLPHRNGRMERSEVQEVIHLSTCWTGRRWINIGRGMIAVGFGPNRFIERVMIGRKLVYAG